MVIYFLKLKFYWITEPDLYQYFYPQELVLNTHIGIFTVKTSVCIYIQMTIPVTLNPIIAVRIPRWLRLHVWRVAHHNDKYQTVNNSIIMKVGIAWKGSQDPTSTSSHEKKVQCANWWLKNMRKELKLNSHKIAMCVKRSLKWWPVGPTPTRWIRQRGELKQQCSRVCALWRQSIPLWCMAS